MLDRYLVDLDSPATICVTVQFPTFRSTNRECITSVRLHLTCSNQACIHVHNKEAVDSAPQPFAALLISSPCFFPDQHHTFPTIHRSLTSWGVSCTSRQAHLPNSHDEPHSRFRLGRAWKNHCRKTHNGFAMGPVPQHPVFQKRTTVFLSSSHECQRRTCHS